MYVTPRLVIGGRETCGAHAGAMIHACKKCHRFFLGYQKALPQDHPNYLFVEHENDLYINMIDPHEARYFRPSLFTTAVEFIDRHIEKNPVAIHCERGLSRSPSVALVYLASTGMVANSSFDEARAQFSELYPSYAPGEGIETFLRQSWEVLIHG